VTDNDSRFAAAVSAQAARKVATGQAPRRSAWSGFGVFGMIGWSIVVPTLAGTALGTWLDRHGGHAHSWTLPLLVAGLILGCGNAWYWVATEIRRDE